MLDPRCAPDSSLMELAGLHKHGIVAAIAQVGERSTEVAEVLGSIPSRRTIFFKLFSRLFRRVAYVNGHCKEIHAFG